MNQKNNKKIKKDRVAKFNRCSEHSMSVLQQIHYSCNRFVSVAMLLGNISFRE